MDQHWDIHIFVVHEMSVLSKLNRLSGGKGLFEKFAEEHNLTTYTMNETPNGKQTLTNNDTSEQ